MDEVVASMGAAVARVAGAVGGSDVIDRLAALSGSDFISLMFEVARRRSDHAPLWLRAVMQFFNSVGAPPCCGMSRRWDDRRKILWASQER